MCVRVRVWDVRFVCIVNSLVLGFWAVWDRDEVASLPSQTLPLREKDQCVWWTRSNVFLFDFRISPYRVLGFQLHGSRIALA